MKLNNNGFTLGEFITVMVIILLLCFAAIPQFFALRNAPRASFPSHTPR